MKKLVYVILIGLLGCSKGEDRKSGENTIEYQVTAVNTTQLNIAYTNESKNMVGVMAQSGWKYSFKSTDRPLSLTLQVGGYNTNMQTVSITEKILVNGVVKAEKTEGGQSAIISTVQYTIE